MSGDALLIWGLALLGIAAILLFVEVFVPSGGMIAALSGVSALAGVVLLWSYDTTWGIIGLLAVLILGPTAIYWIFKMMPYTPMGRALLGGRPEEELEALEMREREHRLRRESLIGKTGVTLTDMRPVGDIEVDGETFEALAEHAWIDAGTPVIVTHADGMEIKVRPAGNGGHA